MKQLEIQLEEYSDQLRAFKCDHRQIESLLSDPDYASVNVEDESEFDELVGRYKNEAYEITTSTVNDELKIATIKLMGKLPVQGFGQIDWVELNNYDKDQNENYKTGLQHAGFYQNMLDLTREVFTADGINFKDSRENNYPSIKVAFGDDRELVLSSSYMEGIWLKRSQKYGVDSHWRRDMDPKGKGKW